MTDSLVTVAPVRVAPSANIGRTLPQFISRKPLGAIGGGIIIALIAIAFLAPVLAPYEPKALVGASLRAPSNLYPLGTDEIGRDVLSRIIWGARLSLWVSMLAVAGGTIVGLV